MMINVFVQLFLQLVLLHSSVTFLPALFPFLMHFVRIEYKILSLTYKVLTTAQPSYLRNLISVDSPHVETRSSSVTLSRPSSSSSLKITDRMIILFLTLLNRIV